MSSSPNGVGVRKSTRVHRKRSFGDEYIDPTIRQSILAEKSPKKKKNVSNQTSVPKKPSAETPKCSSISLLNRILGLEEEPNTSTTSSMAISGRVINPSTRVVLAKKDGQIDAEIKTKRESVPYVEAAFRKRLFSSVNPTAAQNGAKTVETLVRKENELSLEDKMRVFDQSNPRLYKQHPKQQNFEERRLEYEASLRIAEIREATAKKILENRMVGMKANGGQAAKQNDEIRKYVETNKNYGERMPQFLSEDGYRDCDFHTRPLPQTIVPQVPMRIAPKTITPKVMPPSFSSSKQESPNYISHPRSLILDSVSQVPTRSAPSPVTQLKEPKLEPEDTTDGLKTPKLEILEDDQPGPQPSACTAPKLSIPSPLPAVPYFPPNCMRKLAEKIYVKRGPDGQMIPIRKISMNPNQVVSKVVVAPPPGMNPRPLALASSRPRQLPTSVFQGAPLPLPGERLQESPLPSTSFLHPRLPSPIRNYTRHPQDRRQPTVNIWMEKTLIQKDQFEIKKEVKEEPLDYYEPAAIVSNEPSTSAPLSFSVPRTKYPVKLLPRSNPPVYENRVKPCSRPVHNRRSEFSQRISLGAEESMKDVPNDRFRDLIMSLKTKNQESPKLMKAKEDEFMRQRRAMTQRMNVNQSKVYDYLSSEKFENLTNDHHAATSSFNRITGSPGSLAVLPEFSDSSAQRSPLEPNEISGPVKLTEGRISGMSTKQQLLKVAMEGVEMVEVTWNGIKREVPEIIECHLCRSTMRLVMRKINYREELRQYPAYRCIQKRCQTFRSVKKQFDASIKKGPLTPSTGKNEDLNNLDSFEKVDHNEEKASGSTISEKLSELFRNENTRKEESRSEKTPDFSEDFAAEFQKSLEDLLRNASEAVVRTPEPPSSSEVATFESLASTRGKRVRKSKLDHLSKDFYCGTSAAEIARKDLEEEEEENEEQDLEEEDREEDFLEETTDFKYIQSDDKYFSDYEAEEIDYDDL